MDHCDRCGGTLAAPGATYQVRIEVVAGTGPLEVDEADLGADLAGELERLGQRLEQLSQEEAEAQVHCRFEFVLCRRCQVGFVRDPLGRGTGGGLP